MKKNKYKIVEYDIVHNIYVLKKKFWFIYYPVTAGPKEKLMDFIKNNE